MGSFFIWKKEEKQWRIFFKFWKIAPRSGKRNEQTVEPDGWTDKINPNKSFPWTTLTLCTLWTLLAQFAHFLYTFCTLFHGYLLRGWILYAKISDSDVIQGVSSPLPTTTHKLWYRIMSYFYMTNLQHGFASICLLKLFTIGSVTSL